MSRGYDRRRWRRLSKLILQERPHCERADCDQPSAEVHHIDGLGPAGPRGYDRTNLLALCKPHHSQITARSMPKRPSRKREPEPHPGVGGTPSS